MTREENHGRTNGPAEEPLTPTDLPAPSHAERARTLVAGRIAATLCTVSSAEPVGYPYGSLVTFALDGPDPVFLISRLAAHTKNLLEDPRASLLVAEESAEDPLASGRVTLVGDCIEAKNDDTARDAFLAAHPGAKYYAGFSDFSFFRLTVASIRYIGGYGRMSWVDLEGWQKAEPDPFVTSADGILTHMNDDHAAALTAYARAFTRASETERAVMTGIDRYGFEMSVTTPDGPRPARVAFDAPIATPNEARVALVALAKRAREKIAER